MTKTIKVGQLPGKIVEVAVEENATIGEVLTIAELNADGFEIKADGTTVNTNDVVGDVNMVLLTKKVKGNADMNTVKVGQLPGKIEEYTFEAGTTVAQALEIAGLSTDGFEIKVDGNVANESTVIDGANMILLAKKVKGNSGTVKIGQLPGKIEEYTFESNTTVGEALEIAGLSADGFEIKVDGNVASLDTIIDGASMVLLAKKVKGNAGTVKIGQLPGKIEEYSFEEGTTVAQALEIAGLSAEGFEIKVDGNVADLSTTIDGASMVLLAKKVKGNK